MDHDAERRVVARNGAVRVPTITLRSVTLSFALSAKGSAESASTGLMAGADDYVRRPFEARELISRIRAQIRNRCVEGGWILAQIRRKVCEHVCVCVGGADPHPDP